MAQPESDSAFQSFPLPIRLVARTGSRRSRTFVGLLAILALAAFEGLVGFPATWSWVAGIATFCVVALLFSYPFLQRRMRALTTGLPADSVEISYACIRCRDLVESEEAWSALTSFRWVLGGDANRGRPVQRGDGTDHVAPDRIGNYVVEAASRDHPIEDPRTGCYADPKIQFDLPQMLIGAATRARADWVVAWLNELQRRAIVGDLAPNEVCKVPNWLNIEHPPIERRVG